MRCNLLKEVRRLAQDGRFDDLLIESIGVFELLPVAAPSNFRAKERVWLADVSRLDTCLVGEANAKDAQPATWQKLNDLFPVW